MTNSIIQIPLNKKLVLSKKTKLINIPEFTMPLFERFMKNTEDDIISSIALVILQEAEDEKLFDINTEGTDITITAHSREAAVNGLMTVLQHVCRKGFWDFASIKDKPNCDMRGIKLMMPAPDEIDDFKAFIDMMVFYRHNTIMLEIGGAMEYKLHPEINEGWIEYCKEMSEYSGKSIEIQEYTFPWRKNSIHSNNGGGTFLTQKQIKEDIIDYCLERGVEIIPEVPSTSHCDYMLIRHPELAERAEDPYPDTFCPSNPKSYELLFDILSEVVDLFKPNIINIGHDEYYSINICDRCRCRRMDASDVFAEDVLKIYGFLKEKGVKTMLWCDKLVEVELHDKHNVNFGGACCCFYPTASPSPDYHIVVPPVAKAREKLPKDLLCLHWLWSFGAESDEYVRDFPMYFGNFRGIAMRNYHNRIKENYGGSICSNWGGMSSVYLQRNLIYLGLAYNNILYFDKNYNANNDDEYEAKITDSFISLYNYNNASKKNCIEVTHTTDHLFAYSGFADGVYAGGKAYMDKYELGKYVVTYTDNSIAEIPVVLGENIGNCALPWYGKSVNLASSDDAPGGGVSGIVNLLAETSFSTIPRLIDDKIYYTYTFSNPYDKEISKVEFILKENADWTVWAKEIKY